MTFKVSESISLLKKAKKLGKKGGSHDCQSKWINFSAEKGKKFGQIREYLVVMTFKVSESILMLKKAKNLGKYKIFLMPVYMIYFYSKRFRFAPSFNK